MGIKTAISNFRNGLSIIFGKPREGEGDRKLAKMSIMVMEMIPQYGKVAVRTQVIKSIEGDLKRATKKGPDEVEKKIANALSTPEYRRLLHRLDLNEYHLRVIARDIKKKHSKDDNDKK